MRGAGSLYPHNVEIIFTVFTWELHPSSDKKIIFICIHTYESNLFPEKMLGVIKLLPAYHEKTLIDGKPYEVRELCLHRFDSEIIGSASSVGTGYIIRDRAEMIIDTLHIPVCESGPSYFGVRPSSADSDLKGIRLKRGSAYVWLHKVLHPQSVEIRDVLRESRTLPSPSPTKMVVKRCATSTRESINKGAHSAFPHLADFLVEDEQTILLPKRFLRNDGYYEPIEEGVEPQRVFAVLSKPLRYIPALDACFFIAMPCGEFEGINQTVSVVYQAPLPSENFVQGEWCIVDSDQSHTSLLFDCGGGVIISRYVLNRSFGVPILDSLFLRGERKPVVEEEENYIELIESSSDGDSSS